MSSDHGVRTALITGANRGIGLAVASKMAALGYRVVIGARDATAAKRTAAAIGGSASGVQIDVSDEASVQWPLSASAMWTS